MQVVVYLCEVSYSRYSMAVKGILEVGFGRSSFVREELLRFFVPKARTIPADPFSNRALLYGSQLGRRDSCYVKGPGMRFP